MESRKVAGGHGRLTTCVDPRQIQKLNKQASVLFGDDHLFEPNFSAPMPFPEKYDDPVEEELLGVEYAYCQSTDFTAKKYYIEKGLLQDWQTEKKCQIQTQRTVLLGMTSKLDRRFRPVLCG